MAGAEPSWSRSRMGSNISLERLKLNRRLVRYRGYADDALRQAARSDDPDVRKSCLGMAAQWSALASELEDVVKEFDAMERDPQTAGPALRRFC